MGFVNTKIVKAESYDGRFRWGRGNIMEERFRDDANMRMKQTFTRIIPFQDLHIIKKNQPTTARCYLSSK